MFYSFLLQTTSISEFQEQEQEQDVVRSAHVQIIRAKAQGREASALMMLSVSATVTGSRPTVLPTCRKNSKCKRLHQSCVRKLTVSRSQTCATEEATERGKCSSSSSTTDGAATAVSSSAASASASVFVEGGRAGRRRLLPQREDWRDGVEAPEVRCECCT